MNDVALTPTDRSADVASALEARARGRAAVRPPADLSPTLLAWFVRLLARDRARVARVVRWNDPGLYRTGAST